MSGSSALITVLVPSSNSGPAVATTVQSALAQDETLVEVLVLDDGSSDDGPTGLPDDDPRLRVVCQPRRGLARTLNLGLAIARTPWVSIVSPRDVLAPGWLDAVRSALETNPRPAAVLVRTGDVDPFGEPLAEARDAAFAARARDRASLRAALLDGDLPSLSGAVLDRALALRSGGFDPTLRRAHEQDLWVRLLDGRDAIVVPQRLVVAVRSPLAPGDAAEVAAERGAVLAKVALDGAPARGEDADRALADALARAQASGVDGLAAELAARTHARDAGSAPTAPADDPPAATPTLPQGLRVALEVASLDRGGLESVVGRLARALRADGHAPLVVCTERGGATADALRADGIEVVVLRGARRADAYASLLVERHVELVDAHFSTFGTRIASALGIPVLATLHNAYAWLGSGVRDEMRAVDPLLAGYVAVSESVADFCARRFGLARARMTVIRNPVDPARVAAAPLERAAARRTLGVPEDARLLVQIGRVDPVKCQMALVAALERLAPARAELRAWIVGGVGDPAYAHRVRARIARAGLADRVTLAGERGDVPTILAAADVYVMPSIVEGLSLAAIEAMAAGVPAVLTRTGDAAWLLGEEESTGAAHRDAPLPGALLDGPPLPAHVHSEVLNRVAASDDPPHAAALVDALAAVLDDLPRRSELARARAAALGAELSPDVWLQRHVELYAAVAADGAVRRRTQIARATACHTAAAAAERSVRAALESAVDELSRVLLGNLAARRSAAGIETTRDELASALIGFSEAGEMMACTLEKLRLGNRLRTALRGITGRGSGDGA